MDSELLSILKTEVKPALGCTGPTSVSFGVSVARDAVGGKAKAVKLIVDRDTYKNSIAVGIPGSSQMGVVAGAALGAICGDSEAGLEVLKNITPDHEKYAEKFAKESVELEIKWDFEGVGLYIEAFVETENGMGHAIVAHKHTNVILVEANGEIKYEIETEDKQDPHGQQDEPIGKYSVNEFYQFARHIPIESIQFLKAALELNKSLALSGLEENLGIGFGNAFGNFSQSTVSMNAKRITAAASDARMSGKNLSAMSCAGSGNVGITASIPLTVVAEAHGKSEDDLLRALSFSFLLTIYIKNIIGRLSAMCACAMAASIGVTAGTAYLAGGSYGQIESAIKNVVGSIGGILCDGAKLGCSLKLSMAVGVAIESAYLAIDNASIPSKNGIVCETADETLALLGRIAKEGMIETDKTLCRAIFERENS